MTTKAYPLAWPDGWPRTPAGYRLRSKFGKTERVAFQNSSNTYQRKSELTVSQSIQRVLVELGRFGVREGDAIISTNIPVRLDGLPRGDARAPSDPGVAVYWTRPGEKATKVMAIDMYDRVADNLAAIAATLEAMRAIERHGGAKILERAFTGFTALPTPDRPWREVLSIAADQYVSRDDLDLAYKRARSSAHPDREGGSAEAYHQVERAYESGRAELGLS